MPHCKLSTYLELTFSIDILNKLRYVLGPYSQLLKEISRAPWYEFKIAKNVI